MGTPDVLMIEAAPGAKEIEQAKWRGGATPDEGVVDALPYIDHDYADPKVKAEVDKMIAEEMRLSSKKPADFLAELPAVPSINPQVSLFGLNYFEHFTQYSSPGCARVIRFSFVMQQMLWKLRMVLISLDKNDVSFIRIIQCLRKSSTVCELEKLR